MVEKKAPHKKATKKPAAKKPVKKTVVAKKVVKPSDKSASTKDTSFAVIETGGKQYQVSVGDTVTVERITELGGKDEGTKVVFDMVLLTDNGKDTQIGDPYLKGAKVEGVLVEEGMDIHELSAELAYNLLRLFRLDPDAPPDSNASGGAPPAAGS